MTTRTALAVAVTALLLGGCSGGGASSDVKLANVSPIVMKSLEAFGVTQIGAPEMLGGTVMIQLSVYPKDELEGLASGVCREVASYIRGEENQSDFPDLVQIYGNNGDYWLQCEPDDIPAAQAQHYHSDACEKALNSIAQGGDIDLDACTTG